MNINLIKPMVNLTLSIDEAMSLMEDIEDMDNARTSTLMISAEIGTVLEDAGYLDNDPDPETPAPVGTVITIQDPAVDTWNGILREFHKKNAA